MMRLFAIIKKARIIIFLKLSGVVLDGLFLSKHFFFFFLQIVRLKNLLVREEREKESALARTRKFEEELMTERRRCTEFSSVFERAKKVFL